MCFQDEVIADLKLIKQVCEDGHAHLGKIGSYWTMGERARDVDLVCVVPNRHRSQILDSLLRADLYLDVGMVSQDDYRSSAGVPSKAMGYHFVIIDPEKLSNFECALAKAGGEPIRWC